MLWLDHLTLSFGIRGYLWYSLNVLWRTVLSSSRGRIRVYILSWYGKGFLSEVYSLILCIRKYFRMDHSSKVILKTTSGVRKWLVKIRKFAELHIRWRLGRGFIDFWYDYWAFDKILANLCPLVDPLDGLADEFFNETRWDKAKLKN